jgi:uncharacterized protein (DUF302 family)
MTDASCGAGADTHSRRQPANGGGEETGDGRLDRDGDHHQGQPRSVTDTVSRLTGILSAKGLKIFAVIDQSAEASQVGMQLRATTLVLFGNPAAGTPVMAAAPLAALDLPLKVLVWEDDGQTKVSYYGPAALAAHYDLSADLAAKLAGIDPVTDALIAP